MLYDIMLAASCAQEAGAAAAARSRDLNIFASATCHSTGVGATAALLLPALQLAAAGAEVAAVARSGQHIGPLRCRMVMLPELSMNCLAVAAACACRWLHRLPR